MSHITGRVEVLVNGELLLNKAGAKAEGIGISGEPNFELEAVIGDTGLHGYVEKPVQAKCTVTVTDRDDIRLDTFARIFGHGTVIFRAARTGKVYTMHDVTCLRNFGLTAGDGAVELRFEGPYWVETVAT